MTRVRSAAKSSNRRFKKLFDWRTWHWMSSAVCLVGMLLFAVTGITLNHASQIEAAPTTYAKEAVLPSALLTQLNAAAEQTALPHSFQSWYQSHTGAALPALQQVQWSEYELYVALPRAGGDGWFSIALDSGEFYQEITDRGWVSYLNDLHKGRNTGFAWRMFIDVFSVACVVFSLTGLWLLYKHSRGRKSTWPLVAAGFVLPVLVLMVPAHAKADEVEITIPRLNVAEYHPPYVAVWLADSKQQRVADIAVWYDVNMADKEGEKWLKDLRLWWRRSGRSLSMPVDGVTGATRRPGTAKIDLTPWRDEFKALPAGEYTLFVEAARELGGREVLKLPVTLPITAPVTVIAEGKSELATTILTMEP
ncbi:MULTISPECIES: PepSY-associated TM helix domain-containing protein [Pseudoalteromonas]|uniref:PepSY-associated TM helix domain-containing protein n=1 Tax=Pseudoalteromonas TaxID=53246 RepID=UPI00083E37BB|nr:PepSY-associated TM helix domain-containing protein [Pseudoalteromonas sp. BMB]ODB33698.1 hypothetical protein BB427_21130 [Pseudoalteromonas sp. BMB]